MTTEKMDQHYHQQLSALMDGDLEPDQARFLMRRLQHDRELTGCWERWQLCGDVLRGQARAPAPAGFADRVAAAVASEALPVAARAASRSRLARWGGGALAASVAAMALFMGRQLLPEQAPGQAATTASQGPSTLAPAAVPGLRPGVDSRSGDASLEAAAAAAAVGVAVASAPVRPAAGRSAGGSATRTRQAARPTVARAPERAVATASAVPVVHAIAAGPEASVRGPFGEVRVDAPAARPWPRAVLPSYTDPGAYSAGFPARSASGTGAFHPFEPRLPAVPVRQPPQDPSE